MSVIQRLIIAFAALLPLIGCTNTDIFTVKGNLPGHPDSNMQMVYYWGNTRHHIDIHTDAKGDFEANGAAESPVLVDLLDADGAILLTFVAKNGEKIKITSGPTPDAPLQAHGTDINDLITQFVTDNSRAITTADHGALNNAVNKFIAAHPGETAATAIFILWYSPSHNPAEADSLFNTIAAEARPLSLLEGYADALAAITSTSGHGTSTVLSMVGSKDTLLTYVPAGASRSLLVFTHPHKPDSVRRLLRDARAALPAKKLKVLEVAVWGDSAAWRRAITPDSSKWQQGWMPGGLMSPQMRRLNITATPWFMVMDSTGTRLYSGTSAKEALHILNLK